MEIKDFAKLNYSVGTINNLLKKAEQSITLDNAKDAAQEIVSASLTSINTLIQQLQQDIKALKQDIEALKSGNPPEVNNPENPDKESPSEPGQELQPENDFILPTGSAMTELSGLCLGIDGKLYGVSDDNKNGHSGIYSINPETSESELFILIDADLEGITCDPQGNFYVCTEDDVNIEDGRVTHVTWGEDAVGPHTSAILKITPEKEITLLGKYVNETSEQNKGLEGITYYDEVDGKPRFLIGNLKKPIVLILWSEDGQEIAETQINPDAGGTTEIADLYYKDGYVYILDSKTAKLHKYSILVSEEEIQLSLTETKDYSDTIDMSSTLNKGDGENPEALCMDNSHIYIGCDYNCKIYKFEKF